MLAPCKWTATALEVLARVQCLQLLRSGVVGRVVVTDKALPAAFPVNFALLGDDVVFLTSPGSKLEAASVEAVVAFQADEIDPARHTGWSVLVQGPAELIVDAHELARARALDLEPWSPLERSHLVRVRSELVSGRRLVPSGANSAGRRENVAPDPLAGCPKCGWRELLPAPTGRSGTSSARHAPPAGT